jgi:pectinesterase inhibitor-like protein
MVMLHNSFVKSSLLVLALFLCFSPSFCSERIVQVRDICSKHYNPHNCAIILNSIPGVATRGADLGKLSSDVINLANVSALHTFALIHLIKNTSDTNLRQRYTICSENYDDVLFALVTVNNSFTSGNFNDMNFNVVGVPILVDDCGSKALDSSQLVKNNKYLKDVSIIIEIFI